MKADRMTKMSDVNAAGGTPATEQPDYAGAIYGSLLAASVVVGAAVGAAHGDADLRPLRLAGLLIATGLVFWLAHAYARLVGERIQHVVLNPREIRHVIGREWPLLQATLPPAAAAVLLGLLGASNAAAAWAALTVAIAGQVGWATVATIRAGANTPLVVVSALVNLALGLLIVVLKAALYH